ncbi:MAG: DUF2235 domain-containing protein [Rhodocyclaceae bacterium]|nr:DUF2235 domain-containing protein [Rhodocyclaceae bacterium]
MKNVVICCDGTWNTPDDHDGGMPTPTNVVRLYHALAEQDGDGVQQYKYYHPGVGTEGSWWDKAVGGGTGRGLDRNIMSAYRALCDNYEAGDRIFLFGFSRGAYTVRSLAGLVGVCGLLNTAGMAEDEVWQRIERIFQAGYRRKVESCAGWMAEGWAFHLQPCIADAIRFVGVWDTVGALGVPDDMAFLNLLDSLRDYTFHDASLGKAIRTARHAVALDEMRASFQPTLWTDTEGRDAKQVWFPGVHSDVGGGYAECGLADGALKWMMDEAAGAGLVFDPEMYGQVAPAARCVRHDSCKGVFALLPTQPRSAPRFEANNPALHASAWSRHRQPSIQQGPYRIQRPLAAGQSVTVDIFANQPWNDTGVWLEAGVGYRFEAVGEWLDSSIKCGPAGTRDGNFQPAEVAHLVGSLWGRIEKLWKAVGRNEAVDFRFTKRYEEYPWFCLVGAVANGGGVDAKQRLQAHEAFRIGDACDYRPKASGYFYAFSNDAFNCYGNNRGRVRLTIRQT